MSADAAEPIRPAIPAVPGAPGTGGDGPVGRWVGRHERTVFLAVLGVGLVLAWFGRFVQDDAFISFTYARNLARGDGLTWFGTRVEGYTNPLWVLWLATGLRLGAEPVAWAWLGSLVSFAATLAATRRLARGLFDRALPGLLPVLFLVANYTFLAYGTGGLETMTQTALLAWAAVGSARLAGPGGTGAGAGREVPVAAASGLLLALAVLCRPDSALPGAILLAPAVAGLVRRRARPAVWAALLLPAGLLLGGWLAWKAAYYGSLLPNTFRAKTGVTPALAANGARYVLRFLHAYLLWPFLAVGLAAVLWRRRARRRGLGPALAIVVSWCVYLVLVGGDFMEFRLLVPVLPFLALLLAHLVADGLAALPGARREPVVLLTVAVLGAASVRHALTFRTQTPDHTLDAVPWLADFYDVYPGRDWRTVGQNLGERLAGTEAVLALDAVGAIPYYSGLRTVDQLGLTDAWVAGHGLRSDAAYPRPGHQRHAPLSYLRERGVNFVIGHPTVVPLDLFASVGNDPRWYDLACDWVRRTLPLDPAPVGEVILVLVPVRPGEGLVTWYLMRTARLDATIAAGGWPVWSFTPPPAAVP